MHALEERLTNFEEIVSQNFCNALAKKCGLVQRSTSKLKGYEFAMAIMVPNAFIQAETLQSLAVRMRKINKTCVLSAPALAQRINSKGAHMFMRACFGKVLKDLVTQAVPLSVLPHLSIFKRVLIEDSTKADLHEKLSPFFEGNGGAASKSAIKIDYIFDYLSEEFIDVEFFSGNEPDQKLANRLIPLLGKNDLVIRDLGYYALDRIKEIGAHEAYYISRFQVNTVVYTSKESEEPCDLAVLLDEMAHKGRIDIDVFIGKEKHPVRLVACEISEEAINKRRRNANRCAKRHGTAISKQKARLLKYSIFISNVPGKMLSDAAVMATYRARWRIELIFKQWKSCLKFQMFKGHNIERFYCFLYGRLIMILLLGAMSPPLILYAEGLGRELSCYKLMNYLLADHCFPRAFVEGKLEGFLKELFEDLPRRLCMDKRCRLSLRANVRLGNSYCNTLIKRELQRDVA